MLTLKDSERLKKLENLKKEGLISLKRFEMDDGKNRILVKKTSKMNPSQWEKIKKQLKEHGFIYVSEGRWYCDLEKGKWIPLGN